ncbi:protein hunchback-like [Panicum miliaceum]|uniref:Protein hunchback-like n=1 Tax=Panicum miliaceum TaxID=4540 RepID=A0A3L6RZI2_PANMI|nr:protein hunchback-like [Panicum miliaceum]
MQPAGNTTTTMEIWQWQCAVCRADWKMLRQVTTSCPHGHGCRCCQDTPVSPANPPLPSPPHHRRRRRHHHHLHQEEGNGALAADEGPNAGRKTTTLNPAPPAAVAQACWVPDLDLMVQQLREFETLNDEVVALRVQLQEYAGEIERDRDGTNWFLALPASVRDVLVMARDAVEAFVAISAAAPAN